MIEQTDEFNEKTLKSVKKMLKSMIFMKKL